VQAGGSNTLASASVAELVLLPSRELRSRSGGKLPGSFNPVGKWSRIAGLPGGSARGIDQLGGDRNAPGCVLITQAEWYQDRLKILWDRGFA
jgi:hypothetical protein